MGVADEVKSRLDIVAVVSEYLPLEKAGRNFRALCPFHPEKTPSFFLFPERQGWHCFGCGKGGDVFTFVMKKEGLDFGGTLKLLAQKAGVSLAPPKAPDRQDRLRQLMADAAAFYHQVLLAEAPAQVARDYLKGRGITERSLADFGLGFSPAGGQALRQHLLAQGYRDEELELAGLAAARDGRHFDLFRGRLMFPIRDGQGRVLGFGARALDDSQPKYLNSPQTPLFDKSANLFGLDRARGALREQGVAVIVEGYPDVIMAHQYGFRNVVGSMGTALTPRQVGLLRDAQKIVLALDADVAGAEATRRGLEVARQALASPVAQPSWLGSRSRRQGELGIVSLPPGRDPDEVIRDNPGAWERLVREAPTLVEYVMEGLAPLKDPESKSRAAREVLPLIAELEDEVRRELYLKRLAQLLGVSERSLAQMSARLLAPRKEKRRATVEEGADAAPQGEPIEEYCLALLLQHPELRPRLALVAEHFQDAANREVYETWQAASGPEGMRQMLDGSLLEYCDSLLSRSLPPASADQRAAALAEVTRRLEERHLRSLKAQEEALLAELGGSEATQMVREAYGSWKGQGTPGAPQAALQKRGLEINEELRRLFARKTTQGGNDQREG